MGNVFWREKADRSQQVRAEIGLRLREYYDASPRPSPERLAELVKKIEKNSPSLSPIGFAGDLMSKPDEN
jgi:hypothetical protein